MSRAIPLPESERGIASPETAQPDAVRPALDREPEDCCVLSGAILEDWVFEEVSIDGSCGVY